MPAALLFDLDDTLYAYRPCDEAGLEAVHAKLGPITGLTQEGFRMLHDDVRRELARELAGQAASHNRLLFFKRIVERFAPRRGPALALELEADYWQAFLQRARPAAGAHEVLRALAATHPLGLVSNQTTAVQLRKLCQLGFESYFTAIVTSEEAGVEKPHARVFELALTALGAQAALSIMIGDDPVADIQGAAGAGLRTVHTSEFSDRKAPGDLKPDARVHALADLGPVLARLLDHPPS